MAKTVKLDQYKEICDMHHDLIVTMQAAVIEWQHGKGIEAAMAWIVNTLDGPGLIPRDDAPYGKEAQAFFDENRAHPFPRCMCGRPSHIGWMSQGFCSQEHYAEARAKSLN